MQWLAEISVKRPVLASVIILVFVVVGVLGYTKLPVDRFPKIDFPTVSVVTLLPGATPKEMESEVTDKIEEAVNTVAGIDELRSVSSESISQVLITFVLEKNVDVAAQEVRDRIARVIPDLPDDAEAPIIEKLDPDAAPIMNMAVVADRPVREITEFADKVLRRQLEGVSGVGQIKLLGGRLRQINVWLDPIRLRSYQMTAPEVYRALQTQNVQIPAGTVKGAASEAGFRVLGKADNLDEIGAIIVREVAGGMVRLRDVARVEDGAEEQVTVARDNGVSSVVLSLRKQSGTNTVAVVDAVKAKLEEVKGLLPQGYDVQVVRDNSRVIRTSVHAVKEHLVLGAIFAAVVVLIFLGNMRATVISALAIPTSIIAAFGVMWAQGLTINIISLVALALAVGIVIDDAIIVVENIFRHMEEKGMDSHTASIEGPREIGMAVMATTLSLLAVFMPVAFLTGIVGMFLRSFGLTMAFAISVSLLVSFTLTPSLAARMFRDSHGSKLDAWLSHLVNIFYRPVEALYMVLLRFSMRHRWVVVLGCIGALASLPTLFTIVQKSFLPPVEEAEFVVNIRTPEGTSLAATDLMAERFARKVRELPGVEGTLLTIGDNEQRTPNLAGIFVRLNDPATRPSQQDIMDTVRTQIVPAFPEDWRITVVAVAPFNTGMSSANVQYAISGPDLETLNRATEKVMIEAAKVPGIRDLDSTLIPGKPEITGSVDRNKAGVLGASVADISTTLRLLVSGMDVSTYDEGGEQYDIHLQAEEAYRNHRDILNLLSVPSTKAGAVPVGNLLTLEYGDSPSQINRMNRRRQVTITANNAPGVGETAILEGIDSTVKSLGLPADYSSGSTGRSKEMAKAGKAFMTAFVMAFVFMYLILAAQFESWVHPFTILLALPLTLPFAILSLIIFGQSVNIFSMLGILVLFGMVKKNGILQIDHANQLREKGMERNEAILLANKERLRPILMTTLAFVAGMVPMMMATGVGAAYNNATAGVILGGQTLSLLLTLLATPVIYSIFDDIIHFRARRRARKAAPTAS
ncbi:MAG: efflux RND transporter permease subunit [Prosthecobacter sp.]